MSGQTCVVPSGRGAPRFGKKQVRWERFRRNSGASLRRIIGTARPYPAVNLRQILILGIDLVSRRQTFVYEQPQPNNLRNRNKVARIGSGQTVRLPILPLGSVPGGHGTWRRTGRLTGSSGSRASLDTTELSKTGRLPKSGRRPVFLCADSLTQTLPDRIQNKSQGSIDVSRLSRRSISESLHEAVRQILNRLVPCGTVGGRIAPTRKPALSNSDASF